MRQSSNIVYVIVFVVGLVVLVLVVVLSALVFVVVLCVIVFVVLFHLVFVVAWETGARAGYRFRGRVRAHPPLKKYRGPLQHSLFRETPP